jgi:hypothetical protein
MRLQLFLLVVLFLLALLLGGCGAKHLPVSVEDYNEEQVAREAKRLGMRPVDYLHYVNNQHKKPKWEGGVANDGSFESKYEIRLQNDLDDESLYFSPSLREAKEYIKEYGMFHQDLFIYEVERGEVVEVHE